MSYDIRREPHETIVLDYVDAIARIHAAVRPEEFPALTHCQLNILNLLDLDRPTCPSTLAARRGVTRSAISQAVKRLVQRGLVARRQCAKSRRFVELRLTPEGEKMRRWPTIVLPALVRKLLWRLSPMMRQGVLRFLDAIAQAADGRDWWRESRRGGWFSSVMPLVPQSVPSRRNRGPPVSPGLTHG
jgi:DNA-binding MarR family transcriptional regulator